LVHLVSINERPFRSSVFAPAGRLPLSGRSRRVAPTRPGWRRCTGRSDRPGRCACRAAATSPAPPCGRAGDAAPGRGDRPRRRACTRSHPPPATPPRLRCCITSPAIDRAAAHTPGRRRRRQRRAAELCRRTASPAPCPHSVRTGDGMPVSRRATVKAHNDQPPHERARTARPVIPRPNPHEELHRRVAGRGCPRQDHNCVAATLHQTRVATKRDGPPVARHRDARPNWCRCIRLRRSTSPLGMHQRVHLTGSAMRPGCAAAPGHRRSAAPLRMQQVACVAGSATRPSWYRCTWPRHIEATLRVQQRASPGGARGDRRQDGPAPLPRAFRRAAQSGPPYPNSRHIALASRTVPDRRSTGAETPYPPAVGGSSAAWHPCAGLAEAAGASRRRGPPLFCHPGRWRGAPPSGMPRGSLARHQLAPAATPAGWPGAAATRHADRGATSRYRQRAPGSPPAAPSPALPSATRCRFRRRPWRSLPVYCVVCRPARKIGPADCNRCTDQLVGWAGNSLFPGGQKGALAAMRRSSARHVLICAEPRNPGA